MSAPQMYFIFVFSTFEAQIKTHTGHKLVMQVVIITVFNKWTTVSCSENIVRCKTKIISDFCCSIKNILSGKY